MNVEFNSVHKAYGEVTALDGPSFEIPSGSTFGILGTNGAGKTTLFELLVGHDEPDAGRIWVGGTDVVEAGDSVRCRIGFLPERVGFPGLMSGHDVLKVHARIRGVTDADHRIETVLETVGLATDAHRQVAGYSNGMQKRLGLAAALLARPPILVLDEPTAGLDPRGVEQFHRIIEHIDTTTDTTVILSSHVLAEVQRLCDRVAILHDGRLCEIGAVDELRAGRDGEVTVTLRAVDDESLDRIVESIRPFGPLRIGTDEVQLTCRHEAVPEVVTGLDDDGLASISIDEPGLDAVFNAVIEREDATAPLEVNIG